jgi:tetratricopeptide (TPR) repeat protein
MTSAIELARMTTTVDNFRALRSTFAMAAKKKVAKKKASSGAERLARAGQKAMQNGDYEDAVASFEQVLADEPNHLTATYGLAYSLGQLVDVYKGTKRTKTIDRVLDAAQRLIELTPEDSLWPYLEEHKFPRETLRLAYNALAWWGLERACEEADLLRALDHIEHCLSLVSPIDDPELLGYQDTKVRILLRLGRTDVAYEIVLRNRDFHAFADIVESAGYKKWLRAGGAAELLDAQPGETLLQALVRLQQAIAKYGHPTYGALVFSKPIAADELAKAEKRLGTKLPPSYVELVTQHGLFKLLWDVPEHADEAFSHAKFNKLHGCRALLSPLDIARETLSIRKAYASTDDDQTSAQLAESLLFQENYYRDNFYVFRTTDHSVHAFYHDDAFLWSKKQLDFDAHIRRWVQDVLDDD